MLMDEKTENRFVDRRPKDSRLWDRLAAKLNNEGHMSLMRHQVITKVNALKTYYKVFHLLKDQIGVGWDFAKDIVDDDDALWNRICSIWSIFVF